MQKFKVTIEVTINALEAVTCSDVLGELKDFFEDFDCGVIEVKEVEES